VVTSSGSFDQNSEISSIEFKIDLDIENSLAAQKNFYLNDENKNFFFE